MNLIQRGTKRYVNLAKQDPGKARQSSYARARTKFSQPRASLFVVQRRAKKWTCFAKQQPGRARQIILAT